MFKKEFNDVFDYTKLSISELVEKISYSRYWDLPNMLKLVLRKLNGNLDGKEDKANKGIPNGYASLDSLGKVPSNQLPALGITDTFVVATQAAMLVATAETGDIAVRTDVNKTFILTAPPASNPTNWQELLTPPDLVTSVNGQIGAVVITKADVGLSNVDNTSDINKPISTATQTALNLKEDKANKGVVNGYASLDGLGKVPISQLSSVLLSDTFVVGAQADMLALVAETGDVAVRTDLSKTFILTASPASNLANWQELLTPQSPVTSVNGQIGTVTLTKTDVGLSNADNTSDINKPISTAQAVINDIKVDKNAAITGATKTKITYDAKGLITNGEDATTADINPSPNRNYVTDADAVDINNLSGINTGDQTSIAGITGTKAQYNTSLTDGDFLFAGDIALPPLVSVMDLTDGTVEINSGYSVQGAIRPINELPLLSGNIDNTSDKLVLYDASTNSHVFVTPAIVNAPEIFRNNGALAGVAASPFKVGIDYSTGTQYYVNASGNWMAFPPGTTVVLTDLPNGTVSINAGMGGTETAIRPITEQDTLVGAIDEVNDFTTIFDASAGKHVKTPMSNLVKELYRDRGMPNILMTLSDVASLSTTAFLTWTNKFTIRNGGRGAGTISTAGFYDIVMPPLGTNIQGFGGAAGIDVTAAGIRMNNPFSNWSTLYYILPTGGSTTVNTNFRIVGSNNDIVIPDNWVVVATYNADKNNVKLGNGQIIDGGYTTNSNTDLYRDRGMPNILMTLSGIATFSRTNFFNWSKKFMILGGGRGTGTLSTRGFYDIVMPPVGTVITGVAGAQDFTVTTEGIKMRDIFSIWSTLYYILPTGGETSMPANFRLVGYQSDFVIPDNWVLVGAYNADALTLKLGNGQILKQGTDSDGAITPFDATVDFSVNANPNTAGTTFSPNTPVNSSVVYVSTINGSQWTYNGTLYISAPSTPSWNTTGNAGSVQATNFIGTSDNVGLSFRTANQIRQTISAAGNVGIGTTTPASKLQVSLASSNANPPAWTSSHAVFSIGGGANASGLGIGYDTATNEAWIGSLAPSISWRPLRFHGTSWKFLPAGGTEAFTIAANGSVGINVPSPVQKLEVGGNIRVTGTPNYATTAAAIADTALLTGTMYTVTVAGAKQLYLK